MNSGKRETSISIPMDTKNKAANISFTGFITREISAECSVSPSTVPIRKAPAAAERPNC